jgi:hypothetical protein
VIFLLVGTRWDVVSRDEEEEEVRRKVRGGKSREWRWADVEGIVGKACNLGDVVVVVVVG